MKEEAPTTLEHLKVGFALITMGLLAWLTAFASEDIRQYYAEKLCDVLNIKDVA